MAQTRLSLRIDLANGSRLGPGKVNLLEAVRACSSISAAAREQRMSYRRAWLLIDDMNKAFQQPVVETFPGRSHGKGAAVTAFGERLITLYRTAETKLAGAVVRRVCVPCVAAGLARATLGERQRGADLHQLAHPRHVES